MAEQTAAAIRRGSRITGGGGWDLATLTARLLSHARWASAPRPRGGRAGFWPMDASHLGHACARTRMPAWAAKAASWLGQVLGAR